ncbi:MAG: ABC transporter permease [Candidatus Cloacimonetes bacterium]|jgi:lipoprotein-releasing system permease protein|nr:ABC transporter permease [Candidatus Cloacimonadota bacterium]
MNKIVLFFLKKYISSPKREWLRFDSVFMVIGIIISVATLTVALSIFEGYETVLKNTILGVNSHIYIFKAGEGNLTNEEVEQIENELQKHDGVENTSGLIVTQAMAVNGNRIKGSIVRGIDWEQQELPSKYKQFVLEGTWKLDADNSAVLGNKLAKELTLYIGDSFKLISPLNSKVTPMGLKPKEEIFTLVGLYRSGMYEYDSKFIFIDREDMAEFNSMENEFTMVEVKLKQDWIEKADYIAYIWEHEFDYKYQISSWVDFNSNLFSLLKMEKWVIFIILSFLILIASFNVVSSVTTSIIEKRTELGILKAYGASDKILQKIFIGKTLILALLSVTFGQILGVLIAKFFSWQKFFVLKGEVYFLDKINVQFGYISWIIILGVSMLIVLAASLIPLKNISKLNITNIIRKA